MVRGQGGRVGTAAEGGGGCRSYRGEMMDAGVSLEFKEEDIYIIKLIFCIFSRS